jgi:hypothetical protein
MNGSYSELRQGGEPGYRVPTMKPSHRVRAFSGKVDTGFPQKCDHQRNLERVSDSTCTGTRLGASEMPRTADNLYWLARYVERAEYLAASSRSRSD